MLEYLVWMLILVRLSPPTVGPEAAESRLYPPKGIDTEVCLARDFVHQPFLVCRGQPGTGFLVAMIRMALTQYRSWGVSGYDSSLF